MLDKVLLALQALQVLFLLIHDWIPLGRLNDVAAVRSQDTYRRLVLVSCHPDDSLRNRPLFLARGISAPRYPHWLVMWLWISYAFLFIGQLRAWWVPYLLRPEPKRAERYRIMFGNTHSFLPQRNGMVPNTAHILLHIATLATLIVLSAKSN